MPLMRWSDFHAAHPRPLVVFADLEGGRAQARFDLLGRLIHAMELTGDYALHPQEGLIRAGFACDSDAEKFAAALGARRAVREGGWAGQWAFRYDNEVEDTITALLPRSGVRRPTGRTGGKLRRRSLPV